MRTAPIEAWDLSALTDPDRRARLHGDTSPEDLLDRVSSEVVEGQIRSKWKEAEFAKGFWRIEATAPITGDTFDLLFNGRMGYRAQYFLSVAEGRTFNDAIVHRLRTVVKQAAHQQSVAPPALVEMSLNGPDSKIWIMGDWAAVRGLPSELKPLRWADASLVSGETSGLTAPYLVEAGIDIKGTWIDPHTGERKLSPDKLERHEMIYRTGWT